MSDYVEQATRTEAGDRAAIDARLHDARLCRLLHAGMGMATETGEFVDALKKHVFYGREVDEVNLIEELGDLFWYLAVAADTLGVTFEDIQRRNIDKLKVRYAEKFTETQAADRNLDAERSVLETSG